MRRWGEAKEGGGFRNGRPELSTTSAVASSSAAAAAADVSFVTDDPLAAIQPSSSGKKIYSVTRSVLLPRVALLKGDAEGCGTGSRGVNPLFIDARKPSSLSKACGLNQQRLTPPSSSGYGGSSSDPTYETALPAPSPLNPGLGTKEDAITILEQNSVVRSIQLSSSSCQRTDKFERKRRSLTSSSGGTLTTIQEGKIDFSIPRPIWPKFLESKAKADYDSLLDEAVMLYTSLSYVPDNNHQSTKITNNEHGIMEMSVQEVLVELLNSINKAMEDEKTPPEDLLKHVNAKIRTSLDLLKHSTEEDVRKLCVNLSNSKRISSVVRAFNSSGTTSSSGTTTEEIYQIPSGSSSSGFSDSIKAFETRLPVFVHEDLQNVPNGVRNAMIYGTLCRGTTTTTTKSCGGGDSPRLLVQDSKNAINMVASTKKKSSLLRAAEDSKPSVWQQYYGIRAEGIRVGENYIPKPSDVPLFPGGRPEADFTLDLPRSELLSKRMKADKRWRCRCRVLTSFLGLAFFLLSVMAVSLMLTRGKRMFGSMV